MIATTASASTRSARRRVPLLDLSAVDLHLPTALHVREAAKAALDAGATHYTTRPGLDELRAAVAEKLLRENGICVNPTREVLITCGAREALFVAVHTLLRHGDEALIPQPADPAFAALARQAGARVRVLNSDPASGFAFNPSMLPRLRARAGRRVLLLANPSFPAGSVLREEALQRLASYAVEQDLLVIVDESYEPFVFDGATHISIASLPGMAERTVTLNTFSHRYALSGWRVGYAVAPAALMGQIQQLKQALSICSPAVSQYAALAALTGPESSAASEVALRRTATLAALAAGGIVHTRPEAGFTVLLHGGAQAGAGLAGRIERASGVRLGAGSMYGTPTASWLRLSLTCPVPVLLEAIERLRPLLAPTSATQGG